MPRPRTSLTPELAAIVAEAYGLFRVSRPHDLGVCTYCCMDQSAHDRMLRAGQSEITLDDMREWHFAAYADSIGANVMRWVLPRILEFLASGTEVALVGSEVTLSRLEVTGYPDAYAPEEREFLQRFAAAQLKAVVEAPDDKGRFLPLDDLLCMFALGGLDAEPLLRCLDACSTSGLVQSLCCGPHVQKIGWTSFWKPGPAQQQTVAWYESSALEDRMIAYGCDEANPSDLRDGALRIATDIHCRRSSD